MRIFAMASTALVLLSSTCMAQSYEQRMRDHRLPDREPSSASLQMFRFGGKTVGEPVYVTEAPKFEEYTVSAAPFIEMEDGGNVKVTLKRGARAPVFLDSVELVSGKRRYKPVKATADGKDVTKKLSMKDEDCACFDELVLEFPPIGGEDVRNVTLAFTASAGRVQKTIPLPTQKEEATIVQSSNYFNYLPGSENGAIELDGEHTPRDELGKPNYREKAVPAIGEKTQPILMWVRDDGANLSVALDVAADNTPDGADDKAVLYVRGNDGLKSFTAGAGGGKFGRMGSQYTDASSAEHRVYEFVVPLSELPQLDEKGKWGIAFAVTM
ncbi:MAG: hypothetical protein JXA24_05085 [Proteobacteria bacterium]|nr:hypothetical protein [Pseudomonadota bacterium]